MNTKKKIFIKNAVTYFGSQCIVISIDIINLGDGFAIYDYNKKQNLKINIKEFMNKVQSLEIGEIIITDVSRDGCKEGFDKIYLDQIKDLIKVPLVISGGCSNFNDFLFAFNILKADGVASGTFFSQHDQSVFQTKNHLSDKGVPIRLDH